MKPHRGTLILILGILSLIICQPVGIAAWIMGNADLKQIAAGTMDPEGKSLTQIGKILGIIAQPLRAPTNKGTQTISNGGTTAVSSRD